MDNRVWIILITRQSKVLRHAGLDPASRKTSFLESTWIPASAGMTIQKDR